MGVVFAFDHILTHQGDGILTLAAEAIYRSRMSPTFKSIRGGTDGCKPGKKYPHD